jgi:hypothetical protein
MARIDYDKARRRDLQHVANIHDKKGVWWWIPVHRGSVCDQCSEELTGLAAYRPIDNIVERGELSRAAGLLCPGCVDKRGLKPRMSRAARREMGE